MDILTEKISEFANYHPLGQLLPSYVKDTTHLLNILKEIDVLPTNAILVTLSRFFSVHKHSNQRRNRRIQNGS